MRHSSAALSLLLVALVLLAGCSTGNSGTPTAEPAGSNTSTLVDDAVAAADAVETYRVESDQSMTIVANLRQQVDVKQNLTVDRAARKLHAVSSQTQMGTTQESEVYLVNGTQYVYSPAYAQQFSSAWIKIPPSGNASESWRQQDALTQHRRIMNGSDFARNGTATIDGREAVRLETTNVGPVMERIVGEQLSRIPQLSDASFEVKNGSYTFWIDAETHRPLRVVGWINSSITAGGQSIGLRQRMSFDYAYDGSISIELPQAAEDAITLEEATNSSGTNA